jgi:hypothetical protein
MSLSFGRLYDLSEAAETNHSCRNTEKWIVYTGHPIESCRYQWRIGIVRHCYIVSL